ncbi:DUF4404 family protein [Massilia antarctica]|uniref:DUF4404 family protein n=1 Tax=Massilia antarctica TaxID=2765360 RepID=UPI0006BB6BD5|nr:DUF4404 family protein [Massilia sp. H27-R4]MCY0913662.1 DUF4404 family protein [Massilia sp. H27-R4]CUI06072.1 hypothetical protein BN2497_6921 [Janthinobacterium sp. CG23_2]CUU29858.1 hypothetical protein BN3177_6921 [Janthinobacterium sp. CG23_2]
MLNDDTANLKSHLKTLHANLAQTDQVDDELQGLLMQLDGDIQALLDKRAAAAQATISDAALAEQAEVSATAADPAAALPAEPADTTTTYGLAERTQEITARFAAEHPRLEPALRELGRMLSNMGI